MVAQREMVRARLRAFPVRPPGPTALERAAVAIVLSADAEGRLCFVLTRRADRLRRHGGQWALPGGRVDMGETASQTALRELHEELAVRLDHGAVLGVLDDYPTRSGFVITPVVAWAPGLVRLVPNPDEVAEAHVVPLEELGRPGSPHLRSIPESDRPVIAFPLVGTLVHAPTAAILHQLHEVVVHGRATRVEHFEQPVFAWR